MTMKKTILFLSVLTLFSCRKDDLNVLPVEHVSERVTVSETASGIILQNFFGNNPGIAMQCNKKGYKFEAKDPTPAKPYEVTYEYKWSYKIVGEDFYREAYTKSFSANVKAGSYVTLRVQAFAIGTNLKSDYVYKQTRIMP